MPQISCAPDAALWLISTQHTSYAVRIDSGGAPCHVAWGGRLTLDEAAEIAARQPPADREISSFEGRPPVGDELPVDGGARYGVPSLQVRFADGTRAVEWEPAGHDIREIPGGAAELELNFHDRHYPLDIGLHYRVYDDSDVIERWTTLRNTGTDDIVLLRADSAAWTLPPRADYRLSHVTGQWAAETQLGRETLPFGETVLTSRRGIPSHHANPWVMLDGGDASEDHGQVWSAALAWSGSWRITAQRTASDGRAGFTGGAGHDSTTLRLGPGRTHTTPRFAGLHSEGGFGAASREWHAYIRAHVLPHPGEIRPVLYNSWEATGFDFDEKRQLALAARAAELGAELYVMDDGWFGARRADRAGLGDWTPSPDRFPKGLTPLADEVHRLGMLFGLWVEPEMVNADSDLYRAHPDWVLHFPHRTRTELRNQLVLNFARDDVADWAYGWLTALVADNGIDFLKWDMNRSFSEVGPAGPDGDDRLWSAYVHNLYRVVDRLRADHPRLRIEACSGGGGRVDLGILSRTDQAWPSDNTDAADRIAIQHGYSQLYPASTMAAWVTDVPNELTARTVPLAFRFHVATAGVLAVGGDLARWSPEEFAEAAGFVDAYKQVRHLVQHGVQHRLRAPVDDGPTVVQYTSPDRAEVLVLAWQRAPRRGRPELPVHLAGLEPAAVYRDVATGVSHHATVLAEHGLPLELPPGDWASTAIHLRRVSD
ncbi:alpha-galactosidase [Streptomyces niveus]|uniref:alpha-galactosidase n=1 Tax=Streptomyces niveus TaxID=193462 RepID=UPI00341EBAC0